MKKLKIKQETIKVLTTLDLHRVQGGKVSSNCPTEICAKDTGNGSCFADSGHGVC